MNVRPVPKLIRKLYESFEFLAHQLAYHAHEEDYQTDGKTYSVRSSTIVAPYSGLKFYLLDPLAENDNDIKILFRGTKDLASLARDFENGAPGHATFHASLNHILQSLNLAIADLIKRTDCETVSVTICGHSLGATDAQNFFAALIKKIHVWREKNLVDVNDLHYEKISAVRLAAFNAPGITHAVAEQATRDATALSQLGVTLEVYWLLVDDDLVQQTGEVNVLANVASDIAKVHIVNGRLQTSTVLKAHTTHLFHSQAYLDHYHDYYCNENPWDVEIINEKLNRKLALIQYRIVDYSKSFIQSIINWANFVYTLQLDGYDNASHLIESQEPWLYVDSYLQCVTSENTFTSILKTGTRNLAINISTEDYFSLFHNPKLLEEVEVTSTFSTESLATEAKGNELAVVSSKPAVTITITLPTKTAKPVSTLIIEEVKDEEKKLQPKTNEEKNEKQEKQKVRFLLENEEKKAEKVVKIEEEKKAVEIFPINKVSPSIFAPTPTSTESHEIPIDKLRKAVLAQLMLCIDFYSFSGNSTRFFYCINKDFNQDLAEEKLNILRKFMFSLFNSKDNSDIQLDFRAFKYLNTQLDSQFTEYERPTYILERIQKMEDHIWPKEKVKKQGVTKRPIIVPTMGC